MTTKFQDNKWDNAGFAPYQLAADIIHCRTFGHALSEKESLALDEQIRQLSLNVKMGTRGLRYN